MEIVAILSMSDKEIEDATKIVSAAEKVLLFCTQPNYLLSFHIISSVTYMCLCN